ncbi:hypothetical protein C241_15148 [Bradyrhizobium lupini HPC(L)]|uniref:Uncharacterized protein n=1 Tax=Bradyrhizobium lupini HPC(L) TaxID=1229491 RepID=A0ABP2RQ38_RHILU|nr:hypothetical protein C241_15148 [Bradyrhizobium lupini HPC(L)]
MLTTSFDPSRMVTIETCEKAEPAMRSRSRDKGKKRGIAADPVGRDGRAAILRRQAAQLFQHVVMSLGHCNGFLLFVCRNSLDHPGGGAKSARRPVGSAR